MRHNLLRSSGGAPGNNARRGALGATGNVGSVSISPDQIPNLAGWFDASDDASFTFSSGDVVSQWNDKSGNGRHLTQAVVAKQPRRNGIQNGLAAVTFDGVDDALRFTPLGIAHPLTLFGVYKITSGDRVFGNTTIQPLLLSNAGKWAYFAAAIQLSAINADNGIHVHLGIFNGVSGLLRVDGVTSTPALSPGTAALTDFMLGQDTGGTSTSGSVVCEICYFTGAISVSNYLGLEAYAKLKWATP